MSRFHPASPEFHRCLRHGGPVVYGPLAVPLMIASTAFEVVGAFQEASAQKQAAKANAQIAANNAIVSEQNAKYEQQRAADARSRGQKEAADLRRRMNSFAGSQRTSFAGSGVTVDTGSPLDTLSDVYTLGNEDVFTAIDNSEREAYGYDMSAYNYKNQGVQNTNQSMMYRTQAANISPGMKALSAGLSGASTVSTKWDAFKSAA